MLKLFGTLSAALLMALPTVPHAADTGSGPGYYVGGGMTGGFTLHDDGAATFVALNRAAPDALDTLLNEDPGAQAATAPRQATGTLDIKVSPVPEPSIWALLCVGLVTMALRGSRRESNQREQKLG